MPDIETSAQRRAAGFDTVHERAAGLDAVGAERRVSAAFWLYVGTVVLGAVSCIAWTIAGWGPFAH